MGFLVPFRRSLPAIAASLFLASATAAAQEPPGQGDWMYDRMTYSGCDEASKRAVAEGSRQSLENSVRLAERAIEPPLATSDLGCFANLDQIPIDTFTRALDPSAWLGAFDSWAQQLGRGLCRFAENKWAAATRPVASLNAPIFRLQDRLQLGPTALRPRPAAEAREAPPATGARPQGTSRPADRNGSSVQDQIWEGMLGK